MRPRSGTILTALGTSMRCCLCLSSAVIPQAQAQQMLRFSIIVLHEGPETSHYVDLTGSRGWEQETLSVREPSGGPISSTANDQLSSTTSRAPPFRLTFATFKTVSRL